MVTVLTRKTDAERTKAAIEDAIARMGAAAEHGDHRSRLERAVSGLGDAGGRIVDAGSEVVGSGAEWARTAAGTVRLPKDVHLPRNVSLPKDARFVPDVRLPKVAHTAAERARHVASSIPVRVQVGKPPRPSAVPLLVIGAITAAVGAAIAFLFDPQMGRTRRAVAGDQIAAGVRRAGRWSARQGRGAAAAMTALRQRRDSSATPSRDVDEVGLVDRVRSELFRDTSIDKGAISVNAERDVVFLRGTAPTDDQIADIVRRVEAIDGVGKVVNLLHMPGAGVPVMSEEDSQAEQPRWAVPH
jgi:BON domain